MSEAKATMKHARNPSQQHMPGAEATTKHGWSSTQQAMPGAALNRAKWHPHRSPSTTMYSILAATLLTLFLGFNQSNVVDEQQEFFIGGMEDVAYPMIFHK